MELLGAYQEETLGVDRRRYMQYALQGDQARRIGHIEDVLKLIFSRPEKGYGNENHVMTNSRFGDLFDIIYEDAPEHVLKKYDALIDASMDGAFAREKGADFRVLESGNLDRLTEEINRLAAESLPCTVDSLHWLISEDEQGRRFLSIFNNEGNERSVRLGDVLRSEADARVKVTFKEAAQLRMVKASCGAVRIEKADEETYYVDVPAAGFAILQFCAWEAGGEMISSPSAPEMALTSIGSAEKFYSGANK